MAFELTTTIRRPLTVPRHVTFKKRARQTRCVVIVARMYAATRAHGAHTAPTTTKISTVTRGNCRSQVHWPHD